MNDVPVQVVRSTRRRKTVQAYMADGRLRVLIPAHLTSDQESEVVERMKQRVLRRASANTTDLTERARTLARRHRLPEPASIEWSDRQMKRWGSCTPGDRRIRISTRLSLAPDWVLDSVIVHELAHLVTADHGPEFKNLVARYPLTERATGYLIALDQLEATKLT